MNECQNLPEKFLDRLQRIFSDDKYRNILKAWSRDPLPSFRVNPLKIGGNQLVERLEQDGFEVDPVPWYEHAFILKNRSIRELTETDAYKEGLLYIQNLSSMIPALVLDPQPGELVLDMAAAPGSKTTQMAMMMRSRHPRERGDPEARRDVPSGTSRSEREWIPGLLPGMTEYETYQGLIVANDVSRQRLYKMESLLKQYDIPFQWQISQQGVYMICSRGETIWKKFPEYFDKVLVDVPCTMEGRIRCDDPKTYEDWSTKKIKQLSMLQKYMVRSAISATRPGGVIVYSTCTLAPEENEEVIDWVLKKCPGEITIEKIAIPGLPLTPGISQWNKPLNPLTSLTSRITPSETMEGFFVAKIRKLASS